MFKKISNLIILLFIVVIFGLEPNSMNVYASNEPLDYVDPHIGNLGGGFTFPAVGPPFAFTKWVPQSRAGERKGDRPYYYADTTLQGIRGGRCWSGPAPEYGTLTVMPLTGKLKVFHTERASRFSHNDEIAKPYYYSVAFKDYEIKAEVTATEHCGFLMFTFPETDSSYILIQPNNTPKAPHTQNSIAYIRIIPEKREIVGYNPCFRYYAGTGKSAGFSGYFVARFKKPFKSFGTWTSDDIKKDRLEASGQPGVFIKFSTQKGQVIVVKIGTSATSIENARKNLDTEIPGWDFETVMDDTRESWHRALSRIEVEGGTNEQKVSFYTAMYFAMFMPRIFNDVDGSYIGFADDNQIHKTRDFVYYEDYALWDTHRAEHPLLLLVQPERSIDMIKSLIVKAEQGGWLPIFPAWNSYTTEMIGDHAISMIVDAYMKGIRNFNVDKAYFYMHKNATEIPLLYEEYADAKGRRALDDYIKYGYVPLDNPVNEAFHKREQTSRTLEYAYDDFCLAEFAKALSKMVDYEKFKNQAYNYLNVFDPYVGFVRGRYKDGTWRTPFDPTKSSREGNSDITEATPWVYTWYAPHDIQGLMNIMGGRDKFIKKLDTFFKIGQYRHSNEPSHHIAYLYNYAGAPWKTQERVREVMTREYNTGPDGLSGNDDAGQMSAWYILSAMGFYPVCPGRPIYEIGSPIFDRVTIHLSPPYYKGKKFVIDVKNNSPKNKYIQSVTLNGKPWNKPWFPHSVIVEGGKLALEMGPEPNKSWGSKVEEAPPSMTVGLPKFKFGELEVENKIVAANETLSVFVPVMNTGSPGTIEAILMENDKSLDTLYLLLKANESKRARFKVKLFKPGEHILKLKGINKTTIANVEPRAGKLELKNLNIPKASHPEESINIKAEVKNIGSYRYTEDVHLRVNGRVVVSNSITLEPGEKDTVVFSYAFGKHGTYSISVGDIEPVLFKVLDVVQEPYITYTSGKGKFYQRKDEKFLIDAEGSVGVPNRGIDNYGIIYLKKRIGEEATIIIKILNQEKTNEFAKAGIMIRNDITGMGKSPGYVILGRLFYRGGSVILEHDNNGDGLLDSYEIKVWRDFPCWLKLVKEGSTFTGYVSGNGESWNEVISVNVKSVTIEQDVGLFVTSNSKDLSLVSIGEFLVKDKAE